VDEASSFIGWINVYPSSHHHIHIHTHTHTPLTNLPCTAAPLADLGEQEGIILLLVCVNVPAWGPKKKASVRVWMLTAARARRRRRVEEEEEEERERRMIDV
jgi:hypothetical protein